jgi:uncharacterized protein DUF5916
MGKRAVLSLTLVISLWFVTSNLMAAQGTPTVADPPPQAIHPATGAITIDGDLNDDGWKGALKFDHFIETSPGNNVPAKVKTVALLTYDASYFYIGIFAYDPNPSAIRAPYVERDQVLGTDDNIAVFLDTANDKRSALELRVSPRGIQADGIFDDATNTEDFSPDFFYDTAAKITTDGWQAEFRIPLTTLRYPKTDPQTWAILIWRNYPRDFRYAFHSAPIERGSNCIICHTHEITGFTNLPSSHHLVIAPYATGTFEDHRDPGSSDFHGNSDGNAGVDAKWNPTANSAIDATIEPDFSQVEADVPQITENQRFALFFPEKRPFFLEGADLLNSPIQLVYTRTITDPQWGLRATGKFGGDNSYTVLSGRDQGGGLVILPGPTNSDLAPQDFESTVSLGRFRHDFGLSFGSFMFTDREISGGGHNRVLGPDAQWRPTAADSITGQFLFSSTENPQIPPFFNGESGDSHAGRISWSHQVTKHDWQLQYNDYGDEFRADLGFVPQAGFRETFGGGGLRFYPEGKISFIRTYAFADKFFHTNGDDLGHDYFPGIFLIGSKNLNAQFEFHNNEVEVENQLLTQNYLTYFVSFDPSGKIPRITVQGRTGDLIDFENTRVGTGTNISLEATVRPTVHLTLIGDVVREWLKINEPLLSGRLYTADVARLKAVYVFNSRSFVRLIGQYVTTQRDPNLYTFEVPKRDGNFLGSALYGYRLNWQTVLFVGYGDNGLVNDVNALVRTDRSFFIKVSYAWQR